MDADSWTGRLEYDSFEEKVCRRGPGHDWVVQEVKAFGVGTVQRIDRCSRCHVRRCPSANASGLCLHAVHHPPGIHHRYPDMHSEPVGGQLYRPTPGS